MNLRTYEIIANWISREMRVNIQFEPNVCPQANLKTNTIKLPNNIKEENSFATLATLMHEAAHLNYTKRDIGDDVIKQIAPGKQSHELLNVIEDIRIDQKNFRMLPNIKRFYEEGGKIDQTHRAKGDMSKIPLHKKVLINSIYDLEDLSQYRIEDTTADEFSRKHSIKDRVREGVRAIENKQWDKAGKLIQDLLKTMGIKDEPKPPEGSGGGGKGDADEGESDKGQGMSLDLSELKGDSFTGGAGQGDGTGGGFAEMGAITISEITKQKFKELLNIKETRFVEDGNQINAENLISFFTGDIESLFQEDKIIKKKKSKIQFVLDGSGSMWGSVGYGPEARNRTVAGCVDQIITVLDEVRGECGVDVDYDVAGFDTRYYPFQKNTWKEQYLRMGGGTSLLPNFIKAQDALLRETEVDGNRMIILFTDGDVSNQEIAEMKRRIIQHGQDVRCMVIGVGADIFGDLVKDIIGDFNILSESCADVILMEAIMVMISD